MFVVFICNDVFIVKRNKTKTLCVCVVGFFLFIQRGQRNTKKTTTCNKHTMIFKQRLGFGAIFETIEMIEMIEMIELGTELNHFNRFKNCPEP